MYMNGSPKLSEEDEAEVKSLSPKRSKKVSLSSAGASSGPLEEETSSSSLTGSQPQPQAASTPTPSKGRGRGRRNGSVQRTPKNGVAKSVKPKSSLPLTPIPSEPSTKREAVLARWGRDGCYYPGWVSPTPTPGPQTLVQFCDGQSKLTPMSRVVRADIVTPGTLVLTTTATGEYEEALVIKVDKEGPEPMFHVERDNVTREVEFGSIALLEAQVAELTMTHAQKAAAHLNFNDLSLENIISHPRKRAVRTNFADIARGSPGRKKKRQATPEPSTSHGHTFNGPDEYYMDTDSSTHSSCSLDLRGKEVKPLDVECSPPEVAKNESLKLSHYRRKNTKSKDKKVKSAFKGTKFETIDAVKEKAMEVLNRVTENDLQQCYAQYKMCMERCRHRGVH
ncbi:hypothetical protein J6590_025731 [Homalodisca vitripennis]|nr:hypothetical protein J6590_025731 [Homalodisca vitripennis]